MASMNLSYSICITQNPKLVEFPLLVEQENVGLFVSFHGSLIKIRDTFCISTTTTICKTNPR